MTPERDEAGRRRAVTRLFSHRTPCQLHGVDKVTFQKKVRPPTAARRAKRAVLSLARSEEFIGERKKAWRKSRRSSILGSLGKVRKYIVTMCLILAGRCEEEVCFLHICVNIFMSLVQRDKVTA